MFSSQSLWRSRSSVTSDRHSLVDGINDNQSPLAYDNSGLDVNESNVEYGVCFSFLRDLPVDSTFWCVHFDNPYFKMPPNDTDHLIMIGNGSGNH